MTNEEIRMIFSIPEKDLLIFLLNKINLTEKERKIIDYCINGKTEERIAEELDMSRNGVQKIKKNAYEKIRKIWANNRIIEILLKG